MRWLAAPHGILEPIREILHSDVTVQLRGGHHHLSDEGLSWRAIVFEECGVVRADNVRLVLLAELPHGLCDHRLAGDSTARFNMDLRDGWVLDELHKVLSLGKRQHAADGLCNGHNRMRLLRRNLELLEARIELTLVTSLKTYDKDI